MIYLEYLRYLNISNVRCPTGPGVQVLRSLVKLSISGARQHRAWLPVEAAAQLGRRQAAQALATGSKLFVLTELVPQVVSRSVLVGGLQGVDSCIGACSGFDSCRGFG